MSCAEIMQSSIMITLYASVWEILSRLTKLIVGHAKEILCSIVLPVPVYADLALLKQMMAHV